MDRLNWSKLKTFYKVASCGSFARAAEKFFISPSALSKMIKSLEHELNCQLFTRTENGIELTPKGEILYRDAIRITNILGATEESILNEYSNVKKHIKLLAPRGLSTIFFPHFVNDFINGNPNISLEVVPYDEMSMSEKLSGHILVHPFIKDLNGFKQYALAEFQLSMFASQDYLDKFGVPSTVQDLAKHRLVGFPYTKECPLDPNWHLKIGMIEGQTRVPILNVDIALGPYLLASKGIGIVTAADRHPDIETYKLVKVLPEIQGPTCSYYIIIDEVLYENEKIKGLADFLTHTFSAI